MIKSMTGFGHAELSSDKGCVRMEIRSTNHKFSEISVRLPSHLSEFEDSLRKTIGREISRGKVTAFVSAPDPAAFSTRLYLNEALAKEVYQKILRLRRVLGVKEAASPAMLASEVLRYPSVLGKDASADASAVLSRDMNKAVSLALASLGASRAQEGRALERDFQKRLLQIRRAIAGVEKRLPRVAREYKKSLDAKIKKFLPESKTDRERLTLEVALYVKNSDISEEVTRMKSHLDAMKKTLGESGELGRKIDFIAQEMYREANTMGAKSNDVAIANYVIHIKSAIEKIREQAQNVE